MHRYAKLQKVINGKKRYTITPNISGSFITPDIIIKIGEVAKNIMEH